MEVYISLSFPYFFHALTELLTNSRGAECPAVCLQQCMSESVCIDFIWYSKLLAGKYKHSDSKFTGSRETTRELQKNRLRFNFQ